MRDLLAAAAVAATLVLATAAPVGAEGGWNTPESGLRAADPPVAAYSQYGRRAPYVGPGSGTGLGRSGYTGPGSGTGLGRRRYFGPGSGTGMGRQTAYCSRRYRSYDPASGTFLGYDGRRHVCR